MTDPLYPRFNPLSPRKIVFDQEQASAALREIGCGPSTAGHEYVKEPPVRRPLHAADHSSSMAW
jgi:hypothetical protein